MVDGQGYPRGLKEEEILLNARIYAIIDAYDAMTSPRPYRRRCLTGRLCKSLKTKGERNLTLGWSPDRKNVLAETGQLKLTKNVAGDHSRKQYLSRGGLREAFYTVLQIYYFGRLLL